MQSPEQKLNKRERYKARLKPIEYFKEFENLDFENLAEGDRFFLQDFGIFAVDFLEDEFTMRLRIPAGRVTTKQFCYIADVVEEYDLTLITTARSGLQLHDLDADNILDIWKKLNSHGLTTWQSIGDNIRNIVSDVYDGCGEHSVIEAYPIIEQMQEYIVKNPRYVGMLPRRVSIGISGNSSSVTSFFANDLYFALAQKDGVYGFNVYMGGKNTEIAEDADIFLEQHEVFDFFKAFVEAFYLHGSRFSRSKTRLFYLIEDIGLEALKSLIEKEYGKAFNSGAKIVLEKRIFLPLEELKDGTFSYCYQTDFAVLSVKEIREIADFADKNSVEVRIGIDQNIYLLGLKEASAPFASPKESSTIIACAGSLCPYSFWSIKDETKYLPLSRIAKHGITVGFSGCIKGCGRHRHTDIGLVGLKTNNFGDTDGGARIFIGAVHTTGKSVGRMLFSMVPFVYLYETIELIIDIYELSGYSNFEEFSDKILSKFSEEFLAIWILASLESNRTIKLEPTDSGFVYEKNLLVTHFDDVDFLEPIDKEFSSSISAMAKKLWTVEGEDPTYKPSIDRVKFR